MHCAEISNVNSPNRPFQKQLPLWEHPLRISEFVDHIWEVLNRSAPHVIDVSQYAADGASIDLVIAPSTETEDSSNGN
jgi:hypothetical protein